MYYEDTDLVSIPRGITSLRIDSSVRCIPPRAFSLQTSLVNVEYEQGLQVIGESAFRLCSSLREQKFPPTLVEICKGAFEGCERLESVGGLPRSLKVIRDCAFIRGISKFVVPSLSLPPVVSIIHFLFVTSYVTAPSRYDLSSSTTIARFKIQSYN